MGWEKLFRRKLVDQGEVTTELHRILSSIDLTLLGIGSTLGTGIYVLAGDVAKTAAGPAVVISFLVAALASVLAGLCYAEFGARVPKAGSAYVYSYVCVGEVIAFIVGWNLIMEYVIGVASVSKAYSGYVDSIIPDNAMSTAFKEAGTIHVSFLASYFDFFAFGITIVLTFLLMFGVKESTLFNNVFTVLNLLVVLFVIIAGAIQANANYWEIDPEAPLECKNITGSKNDEIKEEDVGSGGFAPFGIAGIMTGAATCFYGFIGFDVIATTGEEAKNPKRAIPISIVLSLLFIFLAYFGISTVLTMMVPYYCQDRQAPLPYAFKYTGFEAGKWIVNVGALFGLATSLLGSMFPMPRIIYSMARDGLLFKFLAYVHPYFQTPMWATLIGGFLGAIMGAVFELSSLIDMMSIGTLTAYTLVALCVLILRYRKDEYGADDILFAEPEPPTTSGRFVGQIFNKGGSSVPTRLSSVYTLTAAVAYCILCFALCGTVILGEKRGYLSTLDIVLVALFGSVMFLLLISLQLQPVSRLKINFTVPLVPWVPAASILVNTYLILELPWQTWVRFAVWMVIGLVIYVTCLCTGLADKTYNALAEEHARNLEQSVSKPALQGIDNPAMEYTDEKEIDKATSEKKEDRKDKSPLIKPDSLNGRKVNGTVVRDNIQQSAAEVVSSVIEEAEKEMIPKIMISDESPEILGTVDSSTSDIENDPEAFRREAERLVDLIVEAAEAHADSTPPVDPEPLPPFLSKTQTNEFQNRVHFPLDSDLTGTADPPEDPVLHQHYVCQDCISGKEPRFKPLLNAANELKGNQDAIKEAVTKAETSAHVNEADPPPYDLLAGIHKTHQAAADMFAAVDSIQKIHEICQLALKTDNAGAYQVHTSSPSVREENQQFIRRYVSDPKNLSERIPTEHPKTDAVVSEEILSIHEAAKKLLAPKDPMVLIHKICQDCLDNVNNNMEYAPLVASRSSREELKKLVKAAMADAVSPDIILERPPISPEFVETILKIHNAAQAVLKPTESGEEIDEQTEANPAETLLMIHHICQLSINGVNVESVPWLNPVLNSDGERIAVKNLNRLVQINAKDGPQAIMVDPEPAPPHVVRQQLNELQRIHAIAQQALSNIIVATSTLHDMDDGYALPDVEPTPENESLLSPAGAEPLYAVVTKKKTKLPKISVTFENQTEILSTPTPSPEVHHETPRAKLLKRRPTGIFPGQILASNDEDDDEEDDANDEEARTEGNSNNSDNEAELSENSPQVTATENLESLDSYHTSDEGPEEETGKGDDDAQPVVTRKQSIQKSVGDLISLFENTAR